MPIRYRGSHTDEFLHAKAREIIQLEESVKEVYVYFNNTAGNAFNNTRLLIENINSSPATERKNE